MTTPDALDPSHRTFRDWMLGQYPLTRIAPELYDLDVPVLLPGEPVPPPGSDSALAFYRPDGTLIDREWPHCMDELTGDRIARTRRFRAGTALDVRTDFVNVDLSHGQGPPLLWETQVYHAEDVLYTCRYASRPAALHGHRLIVHTLDTAARKRRRANLPRRWLALRPGSIERAMARPLDLAGLRRWMNTLPVIDLDDPWTCLPGRPSWEPEP